MELDTINNTNTNNNNNNNNNNNYKGVQLSFENISYTVENLKYKSQLEEYSKEQGDVENNAGRNESQPEKVLTILDNVSGIVEKGELCALMGPSGSGKSTLLDILAKRKSTGKITGKLLINGTEIGEAYKLLTSYVTQEDTLLQTSTVYESLKMHADLKLPGLDEDTKVKRVEQVIEDVGLARRKHSKIGGILPGGIIIKGLSGGEKRRVSIGCALVTNPSLIFLDEPTSGLDAVTALSIMRILLDISKTKGVTIIASIHQPRTEIFDLFNRVMLILKGRMVYNGPNVVEYFDHLGYKCPNNMNPADFCLDSSVEIANNNERYGEVCIAWSKKWDAQMESYVAPPTIAIEKPIPTPYTYQYYILLKRAWKDFLRNQGNFVARVATAIFTGLLFGACFANLKNNDRDAQKMAGVLFFLITSLFLTPFAAISLFLSQRTLFNAERASKVYHSLPYYLAMVTVESFIVLLTSIFNAGICYLIAHLRWEASNFFFAVLVFFFVHLLADFLICTLSNVTGSSDVTFAYGAGFCVIFMLYSGFFVQVNGKLPKSFGWLHHISPLFYGFVSLMQNQFKDLPLECVQQIKSSNSTLISDSCIFNSGNAVLENFGIDDWSRGASFGIVVVWTAFFFTTSYLALHFLNREKR